ncbi:MAG: Adenylosuccinate lyase [Candidatus Beckwithbacteria bacterium GW2011_GWB1_47_15]|uniref:Adenylosuccinate lyase n=1 Tax=Candidatus Beckwithbacteria bacterium GW2011_GWB1_47_15 TaxID=1618371 RepID=A0A0G1UTX8_9BACT|nr:MAG: Adenylosuccinate lyase [Candidatus Beckwithbacteria bacterium GW2011_GWA1_46_30]KKU61160.1 MAG: Adenylosuccinate lyase [Candidatus Beckwithbacteria bacterium GW2011_GWB1_47_15]KKU71999.1 MAG: Adenylosuccinate lyase [Candidatus Beckwithbacteria bacterium GW2011_GWA2_47_25]KKW03237.1 MAG: Adenylosuccinate lyase [Candidatus Beckwithbacteria bacterium GW2011_GWC2_49_11]
MLYDGRVMAGKGAALVLPLSPLDGRYQEKVKELREYFSEEALISYRVKVEVKYLLELVRFLAPTFSGSPQLPRRSRGDSADLKSLSTESSKKLLHWSNNLSDKDVARVKKIEAKIRHDVKAVEYVIGEKLTKMGLARLVPWVHWGLTSEDTNNLSYGLMVVGAKEKVVLPAMRTLVDKLSGLARVWAGTVMPARTHGQVAVPTTLGKEMAVFVSRFSWWLKKFAEVKPGGKLNGAVGNYNAMVKIYPKKDWLGFSRKFVAGLGLTPTLITTQIEPGTQLVYAFDLMRQFNNVGLNLAADLWQYIAFDYLKQAAVKDEVGSSTMPHKVNPIDFENAEGNLKLANGMLAVLADKLPVSRLQRDLSDSTVKRNIGVAWGYSLLAWKTLTDGLAKVAPNKNKLRQELEAHPEMLAEAWQLSLRKRGEAGAYEKVKDKTRGKPREELKEIKMWKAADYVGLAEKLAKMRVG